MPEQTISIGYVKDDDGKYMVVVNVKGLVSEKQAQAAVDFIQNALCGDEFHIQ